MTRRGMPLPLTRSTVPGCVPGGDAQLALALERRDLDLAAERRLRRTRSGSVQTMSSPTRRKNSCGATRMVSSRSPGGRSARVALPPRSTRRVAPFSIAGRDGDLDRARLGDERRRRGRSCTGRRRCARCRGSASTAARSRSGRRPAGSGRGRGRCTRSQRSVVEPGAAPDAAAVDAGLDALVGDLLRAAERGLLEA